MIIVRIQGGLGNQMFQYAVGRSLSIANKSPLFLDVSSYNYDKSRVVELDHFPIKAITLPNKVAKGLCGESSRHPVAVFSSAAAKALKIKKIVDKRQGFEKDILARRGNLYLDGFWQSENYFKINRELMSKELGVVKDPNDDLLEQVSRIKKEREPVCIHVRRGDLVLHPEYSRIFGALSVDYYLDSLQYIKRMIPDAVGYVFSDDTNWVQNNLTHVIPLRIMPSRTTVEDFTLMSACKHFVIANSTFSWWAAWLTSIPEAVIVAPQKFFRVEQTWVQDLVPSSWVRL